MAYLIDYRVGGMGNTILTHAVYSCNKIDLDLDLFFSATGHAHKIRKKYLCNNLIPVHMIEQPERVPSNSRCIIEVKTSLWYKLLEIKMGYSKFIGDTPNFTNVLDFFTINQLQIDHRKMWQEFYQNFKDPSWPVCETYNDIQSLALDIQTEIYKNYKPPEVGVTNNNWISLLTFAYYDVLQSSKDHQSMFGGVTFLLDDYFSSNVDVIKNQVTRYLGWVWDDQKSAIFQQYVLKNNQVYVTWLDNLKELFNKTVNSQLVKITIDPWEKAVLIAMFCAQHNKDPRELPWDAIDNLNSNKELITIFKD
jgi:hypothetical protein